MGAAAVRILLIEDNPADVVLLRLALEQDTFASYRITVVERLRAGLDRLAQSPFDAVLLDLGLPDSQGLETFQRLRAATGDLPIVVLSGLIDEAVALSAVRAGAQDYVVKGHGAGEAVARAIRYAIERQQAQARLRASEKYWRALIDQSHDVIALVSAEGRIRYGSPAVTRVLGYAPEALLDRNLLELLHPDDREAAARFLADSLSCPGQPAVGELRLLHMGGQARWAEITGTSWLEDPDLHAIIINIHDITERKETEVALAESQQRLRGVIDSAMDAIISADSDMRVVMFNEAAEQMFGIAAAEALGRSLERFIPERFRGKHAARLARGERGEGGPPLNHVISIVGQRSNGEEFPAESSISFVRTGAGMLFTAILRDVTQRKMAEDARRQAEESLRESEEKYRGLAEASDAMLVLLDAQGQVHYLNERAAAAQGLQLQDALGKTLRELFLPSVAEVYEACAQNAIARGQSMVVEASAGDTYYRTSIQPIHDEQGRTTRAMLSVIDITELKLAQRELIDLNRSLEERVRQRTAEVQDLYDNAPTGYHSLNAEGRITMINRTELKWLGYERDEVVGHHIDEFITPASRETFRRTFPLFTQRGFAHDVELEFIRKDRSTFPALVNATAIYDADGNYIQSRSTIFDITDRKRAEQALRDSEAQTRLLFESAPDAVVLFDSAGQIVRMNRSFEELSGLAADQCSGRTMDALGLLPAAQVSSLASAVVNALQHANTSAAVAFKLQRHDGETRDVGVRVYGMTLHGSQHYLASMRDITLEKQAEEMLRYANAELERGLRVKDEFLANMSHELRTPMHGILAMSETLLEHIYGPLNERQQKSVRIIEESGQHLLALINDLLDISKIEAGKLELQVEPVLVDDVCHASLQFVREMALKKRIRVEYANAFAGSRLAADAKRLKQMLVNLLSNAVKFTPEGGSVGLSVSIDGEAGLIHFAVQDTGPGIAPADQARLFQPFAQLDAQLSRQYEGTGLGLALVKRLAEQHGGTIRLDSAGIPGQGCRFTLTLPHTMASWEPAPAAPTAAAGPRLSPPTEQGGPLVLVVEDNEVNIDVLSGFLEYAGYRLDVARNGLEGLELAAAHQPDLILMDIQLPLLDGFEVMRRLRAQQRFSDTPIIAITASAMSGDRERCLAAGANDYMSKPLRMKELLEMIRTLTGPRHR